MQRIQIKDCCDFEQCEFSKGLVMNGAQSHLFHFNNCIVKERLWLCSANLSNQHHDGYYQSIGVTNSTIVLLRILSFLRYTQMAFLFISGIQVLAGCRLIMLFWRMTSVLTPVFWKAS